MLLRREAGVLCDLVRVFGLALVLPSVLDLLLACSEASVDDFFLSFFPNRAIVRA